MDYRNPLFTIISDSACFQVDNYVISKMSFRFLSGRRGILFTNGGSQMEVIGTEKQCNFSGYGKRTSAARQQCFVCVYSHISSRRRFPSKGKCDYMAGR